MRTVAVMNYKGGVGKTTLSCNLGAALAARGRRVLLIDLDPQASLTFSFLTPEEWERDFEQDRTIKAWFDAFKDGRSMALGDIAFGPPRVNAARTVRDAGGHLALVCSHLMLLSLDQELSGMLSGGTLAQARRSYLRVHRSLRNGLAALSADSYDDVLIDCPPNFNVVTRTAIVASDAVIVPARPDHLSTLGISYLQRHLQDLAREHNETAQQESAGVPPIAPRLLGVVFTMVNEWRQAPIQAQQRYIERVRSLGLPVFDAYMASSPSLFANAAPDAMPVMLQSGGGETAATARQGFLDLAAEMDRRLA